MLKTNSKQVKDKINMWISEMFDASSYGVDNRMSRQERNAFIAKTFYEELGFRVGQGLSFREAFTEWCQGLPSLIDTAYYYCHHSAVDLVGDILEETKEERSKYSEEEAENLMTYLIYKEVADEIYKAF